MTTKSPRTQTKRLQISFWDPLVKEFLVRKNSSRQCFKRRDFGAIGNNIKVRWVIRYFAKRNASNFHTEEFSPLFCWLLKIDSRASGPKILYTKIKNRILRFLFWYEFYLNLSIQSDILPAIIVPRASSPWIVSACRSSALGFDVIYC